MSTTAVAVELVITGIQAMIWILLVFTAVAVTPRDAISALSEIAGQLASARDWTIGLQVTAAGIAYAIGVVMDRLYDSVFEFWFERGIRDSALPVPADEAAVDVRLDVRIRLNKAPELLEYVRSRVRLARSTCANCSLIAIALTFIAFAQPMHRRALLSVALGCGLLALGAFAAWRDLYKRQVGITGRLHYKLCAEGSKVNAEARDAQAMAATVTSRM